MYVINKYGLKAISLENVMKYTGVLYFSFGYGGVGMIQSDGSQVILENEKIPPNIKGPKEPSLTPK